MNRPDERRIPLLRSRRRTNVPDPGPRNAPADGGATARASGPGDAPTRRTPSARGVGRPNGHDGRGEHPGTANYPINPGRRPVDAYRPPPTRNPHLGPLGGEESHETPDLRDSDAGGSGAHDATRSARAAPRRLTVTRVAALRGRELTAKGIGTVRRAATADGADRSGLTALTIPVVLNYAVDAAMTVALANTLFFAAASAESKGKVALYLALTIAPFALVAPLIGPALDRLQRGRRIAMSTTFGLRVLLALLIMSNSGWDPVADQLTYDPWVLYPSALGLLVLSKSFGVLKSAVTPRVLPPSIDLVRVNSRLTTWGLVAGTILGGAVAALFETVLGRFLPLHVPGAMVCLALLAGAGTVLCMRIPAWVEVTAGEVPTTLSYHGEPPVDRSFTERPPADGPPDESRRRTFTPAALAATMVQPLGRSVLTGLWGNGTVRILTGFLTLYIAFYAKSNQGNHSGWLQLALIGAVGAAAGIGNFAGNAAGTRLTLRNPQRIIVVAAAACLAVTVLTAVLGSILVATIAALVASGASAIGKVCLDSSIQDDLPEESRASAFGRSESILQLCWVIGAAFGVLLPPTLWIGFTVVAAILAIGMAQTFATDRGTTLVPGFGGRRPTMTAPTGSIPVPHPGATYHTAHTDSRNGR